MLALNLIEAGAHLYGIGIQSHIDYVGTQHPCHEGINSAVQKYAETSTIS